MFKCMRHFLITNNIIGHKIVLYDEDFFISILLF